MTVSPVPEGYTSVTPYLAIAGCAAAIDFYKSAFGASEVMRMDMGGKIAHAEITIGGAHIMLSDEFPDMNVLGPKTRGGPTATLMLYVPEVDTVFARAIAAGATEERPVADQFYGDRTAGVRDAFGNLWFVATHKEDVSPEELRRRAEAHAKG